MRFLVDNQLPGALSRFLAERGCDSVHVLDVGLGQAPDDEIWHYACQNDRIVINCSLSSSAFGLAFRLRLALVTV